MTRTAKLAQLFKDVYTDVYSCKDSSGKMLALPLLSVPNRKKYPEYYTLIEHPIDMNTIEKNIVTGQYKNLESFDNDFLRLFKNVEVSLRSSDIENDRLISGEGKMISLLLYLAC